MPSEWRTRAALDHGETIYQTYRLKDASKWDSPENRETVGIFSLESDAVSFANLLNDKEKDNA